MTSVCGKRAACLFSPAAHAPQRWRRATRPTGAKPPRLMEPAAAPSCGGHRKRTSPTSEKDRATEAPSAQPCAAPVRGVGCPACAGAVAERLNVDIDSPDGLLRTDASFSFQDHAPPHHLRSRPMKPIGNATVQPAGTRAVGALRVRWGVHRKPVGPCPECPAVRGVPHANRQAPSRDSWPGHPRRAAAMHRPRTAAESRLAARKGP